MPHAVFRTVGDAARPLLGAFITFDALPVVELLSEVGFDYLAIDTQHTFIDVIGAGKLLYAASGSGAPVLVRVLSDEPTNIGKALDLGADGVIVPMVNTAEQAADIVAACRYNPGGSRSFGPGRRNLGFDPATLQDRVACFAMIETVESVENIAAIAATPGLTGVYFGAGDLAVNMGLTPAGSPRPPQIRSAAQKVAAECRRAGIIPGAHGQSADHARELYEDGFTMITMSGDRTYLLNGAAGLLKAGREIGT